VAKHREFSLARLVAALDPESLRRYLVAAACDEDVPVGATMNGDHLDQWLRHPDRVEVEAFIRQQLRSINDIGEKSMRQLLKAYEKFSLQMDTSKTPEQLALELLVQNPEGFEYAWGQYLLFANGELLTDYHFPAGQIHLTPESLEGFDGDIREFFDRQAKGPQCRVQVWEDDGEITGLIQRGHYLRTISFFEPNSDEVSFWTFRPVVDDYFVYSPSDGLLQIKATTDLERTGYLFQFARRIAQRDDLVQQALHRQLYSLAPVQAGAFDYAGEGDILRVRLTHARLRLGPKSVIELKSEDVLRLLRVDLPSLTLDSGRLLFARLTFDCRTHRSWTPVSVDVTPPSKMVSKDNIYSDAIQNYLRVQGVKLT
jgi:hypothetical protein